MKDDPAEFDVGCRISEDHDTLSVRVENHGLTQYNLKPISSIEKVPSSFGYNQNRRTRITSNRSQNLDVGVAVSKRFWCRIAFFSWSFHRHASYIQSRRRRPGSGPLALASWPTPSHEPGQWRRRNGVCGIFRCSREAGTSHGLSCQRHCGRPLKARQPAAQGPGPGQAVTRSGHGSRASDGLGTIRIMMRTASGTGLSAASESDSM